MIISQKQARLSELREYMCLRESLNNQAAEKATADFKALSEKYKLGTFAQEWE